MSTRNKTRLKDNSCEILANYAKEIKDKLKDKKKYNLAVLSLDAATNNLGFSINGIDLLKYKNLELPVNINSMKNYLKIGSLKRESVYCEMVGETNDESDLVAAYCKFLNPVFDNLTKKADEYLLVIEKQPDMNDVTKKVNTIIMSLFTMYCQVNKMNYKILIIDSSLKFSSFENIIDYEKLSKKAKNYNINKKHSVCEMNNILEVMNYKLEENGKLDDMADAFCMSIFIIKFIFSQLLDKMD